MPPALELISPRSPRVSAARRLGRRSFRGKEQLFLAEGPQAVREAAGHRADGRSTLVELFATPEAGAVSRHRRGGPRRRSPGAPGGRRGRRRRVHHGHAPGPRGVCRFLDTDFDAVLSARPGARRRARPCAGPRQRRDRPALRRRRRGRRRRPHRRLGRPLQPEGRPGLRGSLFHLPVAVGVPVEHAVSGLKKAGVRILAADGAGTATSTTSWTRAPWAGPPPGCSATRPGGFRRRPGRWPMPSCACRSTERPKV